MSKMRQLTVLTALAVLAVLAAGWFLLVSPKRSEAADIRETTVSQRTRNETLRQQIATLQAQAKDLPARKARLDEIGAALPTDPALPALIRSLSAAADSAGIDLVSLAPASPVVVGGAVVAPAAPPAAEGGSAGESSATSATSATPASPPAPAAPPLQAVPVTVELSGGFFQLEQFIANLESLPRAFLLTQFTVGTDNASSGSTPSSASGSGAGSPGGLRATLTGKVFFSSATTPAVVAAVPGTPAATTGTPTVPAPGTTAATTGSTGVAGSAGTTPTGATAPAPAAVAAPAAVPPVPSTAATAS